MTDAELKELLENQQQLLLGVFQTLGMIVEAQEKSSSDIGRLVEMLVPFMASQEIEHQRPKVPPPLNN